MHNLLITAPQKDSPVLPSRVDLIFYSFSRIIKREQRNLIIVIVFKLESKTRIITSTSLVLGKQHFGREEAEEEEEEEDEEVEEEND